MLLNYGNRAMLDLGPNLFLGQSGASTSFMLGRLVILKVLQTLGQSQHELLLVTP